MTLIHVLLAVAVGTAQADEPTSPPAITPDITVALLDPETSEADRAPAMQRRVGAALGGDGRASHLLGALFRSGPDHPSKATVRDPDSARHWLELCLTQAHCPRLTLATLAELELAEGHGPRAMLWAQLATIAEREVHRIHAERGSGSAMQPRQAYNAALLRRVYDVLPADQRDDAVDAVLQAWLATNEAVLVRIVNDDVHDSVEADAGKLVERVTSGPVSIPPGPIAAHAVFLVRVRPESALADGVLLIDGLPRPADVVPLRRVARGFRYKPFAAVDGETARYLASPLSLDDGRFALTKEASAGD
jgi:hypothetical protein